MVVVYNSSVLVVIEGSETKALKNYFDPKMC